MASHKQALECLHWFCRRWRIEEWHRARKNGCKILDPQHHDAATLMRAIALDAMINWRIILLGLLGREVPDLPVTLDFDACECEVLALLAGSKNSRWQKP